MYKIQYLGVARRNTSKHVIPNGIQKIKMNYVRNSCYSTTSDETQDEISQTLKKSIIPTLHFQRSLPRLPIPKLDLTCERYLSALEPIITADELASTKAIVDQFSKGDGLDLDKQLRSLDKKNKQTSFISGPWYEMYFKDRRSLLINSNPALMFLRDPKEEYNNKIIRATNMIVSSLRFMNSLESNTLEPEIYHLVPEKSNTDKFRRFASKLPESLSWYGAYFYKAFPLDMSQYCKLFKSTRIPQPEKDILRQNKDAKNLIVMRKGHIFSLDVIDSEGQIVKPSQIQAMLQHVQSLPLAPCHSCIGVLTTSDRDSWTLARQQLVAAGNEELLNLIDGALFVLSLDDNKPKDVNEELRSCLHSLDGINRWMDKSFTLIIDERGDASINFEHSWGDGVALLRYFNDTFEDSTTNPVVHPPTGAQTNSATCQQGVHKLEFKMNDAIRKSLTTAKESFDAAISSLGMDHIRYEDFGRGLCRKKEVSPDAILQLAIQLAYYRQNGDTTTTYESGSTAAFKHGRTEIVRSCTMETKKACQLFGRDEASKADNAVLVQAIKDCSKKHGRLTREAAMGQGFDRHLFALRNLAQTTGADVPALYQDPVYARFNYYTLSTSTLSSEAMRGGCFGPVVPDGYGLAYVVKYKTMETLITAYNGQRDIADFKQCLMSSIHDIKAVLMS